MKCLSTINTLTLSYNLWFLLFSFPACHPYPSSEASDPLISVSCTRTCSSRNARNIPSYSFYAYLTQYLWHGFEITYSSVNMLTGCIEGISVDKNRMKEMCVDSFITATDLADFLVSQTQLPFRTTHRLVSYLVLKPRGFLLLRQTRSP